MTRRVLVVEDNEANMQLAVALLEVAGFEVLQATTAETAMVTARTAAPDVIVMDIGLPGMDGLQATRALKGDPVLRSTPILITTSLAMDGDRERAIAAGCDAYLTKPIDTRTFADAVAELVCGEGEIDG